jgi:hypothetical protein
MLRSLLALLALTGAVACSGAVPSADADVWLSADHPLAAAQAAWGLPLEAPVELVVLPRGDVGAACGVPDEAPFGCVLTTEAIAVSEHLEGDRRAEVLVHELGHILGGGGHLDLPGCPDGARGEHVMCANGAERPTLTPEDFDFVLGSAPRVW